MTDRGAPTADGSPACPFVAFEDDRDERGDRPDHRHRCFAEAEPAPRALAHQEAYCLSSAFPVCPTFQEWARREAAHAIHTEAATQAPAATAGAAGAAGAAAAGAGAAAMSAEGPEETEDLWGRPREEPPVEERPRRNPPRDWAAPPPWAAGAGAGAAAAGRRDAQPDDAAGSNRPPAPEGQGLAGSAADRLALGGEAADAWRRPSTSSHPAASDSPAAPADPELAGLVGESGGTGTQPQDTVVPPTRPPARRQTVSSTRDQSRERQREQERQRLAAEQASQHDGPSWEKQRRYEAYPSIKTRAGMSGFPAVPTVAILFGGVLLAAIALFFLPAILGVGGRDDPTASPTPSVAASTPSPSPTPVPEPTAQTYVIKSGDTLSAIAREFNVSLDALLAANEGRISNPNRIRVGDEIIIPLPETTEPPAEEASPSAS
jgi:LysM repeat protein